MTEYVQKATIPVFLIVSIPLTSYAAGSSDKPNIDSIAHEGFQLTNYNVDAECTPDP